jgi:hypothetical protein
MFLGLCGAYVGAAERGQTKSTNWHFNPLSHLRGKPVFDVNAAKRAAG